MRERSWRLTCIAFQPVGTADAMIQRVEFCLVLLGIAIGGFLQGWMVWLFGGVIPGISAGLSLVLFVVLLLYVRAGYRLLKESEPQCEIAKPVCRSVYRQEGRKALFIPINNMGRARIIDCEVQVLSIEPDVLSNYPAFYLAWSDRDGAGRYSTFQTAAEVSVGWAMSGDGSFVLTPADPVVHNQLPWLAYNTDYTLTMVFSATNSPPNEKQYRLRIESNSWWRDDDGKLHLMTGVAPAIRMIEVTESTPDTGVESNSSQSLSRPASRHNGGGAAIANARRV